MTDSTATKPKRGQGPLTPTQAADRIATAIGELPERIARGQQDAETEARAALHAHIGRLLARVPDGERDKVARVLLALGCELSGFELQPTNDTASEPTEPGQGSDDFPGEPRILPDGGRAPAQGPEPVEPTERVEIDRSTGESRRVGAGRKG